MSMQAMIAKKLLKTWLKKTELNQGEIRSALMLYEEDDNVHLVSVTLKLNGSNKLEVARVIDNINIDDAI